jgi:hypothetical protein
MDWYAHCLGLLVRSEKRVIMHGRCTPIPGSLNGGLLRFERSLKYNGIMEPWWLWSQHYSCLQKMRVRARGTRRNTAGSVLNAKRMKIR